VLDDPGSFVPLAITRRGNSVNYEAKAVALAGRRCILRGGRIPDGSQGSN
jgi:hypothetical protein